MENNEPVRRNHTTKDENLVGKLNVLADFMN